MGLGGVAHGFRALVVLEENQGSSPTIHCARPGVSHPLLTSAGTRHTYSVHTQCRGDIRINKINIKDGETDSKPSWLKCSAQSSCPSLPSAGVTGWGLSLGILHLHPHIWSLPPFRALPAPVPPWLGPAGCCVFRLIVVSISREPTGFFFQIWLVILDSIWFPAYCFRFSFNFFTHLRHN